MLRAALARRFVRYWQNDYPEVIAERNQASSQELYSLHEQPYLEAGIEVVDRAHLGSWSRSDATPYDGSREDFAVDPQQKPLTTIRRLDGCPQSSWPSSRCFRSGAQSTQNSPTNRFV